MSEVIETLSEVVKLQITTLSATNVNVSLALRVSKIVFKCSSNLSAWVRFITTPRTVFTSFTRLFDLRNCLL